MKKTDNLIKELKEKQEEVLKLAEKFPIFAEEIIRNQLTYNRHNLCFGKRYKDISLSWGINRHYFGKDESLITNRKKPNPNKYLFAVYVNSLSLYDRHDNYGLELIAGQDKIFFFDRLNNEFYIEEEHIEWFLEELNDWYLIAREKAYIDNLKEEKEDLIKDLDRVDNLIKEANEKLKRD